MDNSIQYALAGVFLYWILMPALCVYIIEERRAKLTSIAQIAFSVELLQEMLLLLYASFAIKTYDYGKISFFNNKVKHEAAEKPLQ